MWDFIDMTYVLSVDSAVESQKRIQHHLESLSIPYEIKLFSSTEIKCENTCKNQPGSVFDIVSHNLTDSISNQILRNHLVLIAHAYKNDLERVMILEDDATFDEPINVDKLRRVQEWIMTNPFNIFYLGYCPWPIPISFLETPDIVQIVSPYCTHAYIVSRTGMEKILRFVMQNKILENPNIHFDKLLTTIPFLDKFGIFPMINFQNRDPGLYRRCLKNLFGNEIYISFRLVSRFLEYASVILPIIILSAIWYSIYRCFLAIVFHL